MTGGPWRAAEVVEAWRRKHLPEVYDSQNLSQAMLPHLDVVGHTEFPPFEARMKPFACDHTNTSKVEMALGALFGAHGPGDDAAMAWDGAWFSGEHQKFVEASIARFIAVALWQKSLVGLWLRSVEDIRSRWQDEDLDTKDLKGMAWSIQAMEAMLRLRGFRAGWIQGVRFLFSQWMPTFVLKKVHGMTHLKASPKKRSAVKHHGCCILGQVHLMPKKDDAKQKPQLWRIEIAFKKSSHDAKDIFDLAIWTQLKALAVFHGRDPCRIDIEIVFTSGCLGMQLGYGHLGADAWLFKAPVQTRLRMRLSDLCTAASWIKSAHRLAD